MALARQNKSGLFMKRYRKNLQDILDKHIGEDSVPTWLEPLLDDIQLKFEEYEEEVKNPSEGNSSGPYYRICKQFNYGRVIFNSRTNRIESYNDHVLTQFQYTEKELSSFVLQDLLASQQPEKASETLVEFNNSIWTIGPQDHKFFLLKYRRKDGIEVWMDTVMVTYPSPQEHLVVFVLRDIQKAKAEEEKNERLLEELASVNDELRDFAYVVSHDLKAPLRGIMSITSWLGQDYKDKFDEEGSQMLDLLETRTSRLQQLIDGVLAYSKVSHGGEEVKQIDVQYLVEEIADFLAPPDHIKIVINDPLPPLYFEPTKLGQVFQNIISNSIKYMDKPEGLIQVGCTDRGDMLEFYIEDNGPGIEKTYHDKIFQIFQTLHTRDEVESTGIGLSIVKKIIDKFGGEIWLESVPEEGCTFYFRLPKNMDKVQPNKEYEKWVHSN